MKWRKLHFSANLLLYPFTSGSCLLLVPAGPLLHWCLDNNNDHLYPTGTRKFTVILTSLDMHRLKFLWMTSAYRLWVGQLDSSVVVAMVFSFLVPWFKTPLGSLEQHCYHIFELSVSCQMIIISILANFNFKRYFLPVGYGGSQKVFQKTEYSWCKSFLYFLTFFYCYIL